MSKSFKIAICIPAYGDTKAKFTQSLVNMVVHFLGANIVDDDGNPIEREIDTFIVSSSMLTQSRHKLVAEALVWGADYMLFLDADHTFPPDTLARLWSHNKLIVGCNYARRCLPTAPTAAKHVTDDDGEDHKNLVYTTVELASENVLEEVDHLGFGVCLIDMRVFTLLEAKAQDEGKDSFLPLFHFDTTPDGLTVIGEDVYFFRKVREAGVPVYCDHALSWEVGHLYESIMTNALANKHRERWVEKQKASFDRYEQVADELENKE